MGVVLKPTRLGFENRAVLNPAIYQEGKYVHILYRAMNRKFESTIGYAKLEGPVNIIERDNKPFIKKEFDYEKRGIEDPRLVKIGKTFYMTYVAHDGKNALTALAMGESILDLKKQGIITPQMTYDEAEDLFRKSKLKDKYYFFESYYKDTVAKDVMLWNKDVFFFPEKIKGQFALINRVLPDIQIVYFKKVDDLYSQIFWRKYLRHLSKYVILENKNWFESRNIGGGCPPVKTKKGWLLIYHTVEETNEKKKYHAAAALLDLKNPQKVIGKLRQPLFSPEKSWEMNGLISNVVFPTGTAIFDDNIYIYYGAADKRIAVAMVNLPSLITELLQSPPI